MSLFQERKASLLQKIASLENALKKTPSGNIYCSIRGNSFKYYHYHSKKQHPLPKCEMKLIRELARKKYNSLKLTELKQELAAIEAYEKQSLPDSLASDLLLQHPGYRGLLFDLQPSLSAELAQWSKGDYDRNNKHPETLSHKSISGNWVRSKSEEAIDTLLFQYHIAYRYEARLDLHDTAIYPDFTIRHPVTGKTYYWEHFGLMDNAPYAQNSLQKMTAYINNNILPSRDLICTFETKDSPFSIEKARQIILTYFI